MPAKDAQPPAHVAGLECSDVQWRSVARRDEIEEQTSPTSTGARRQHGKAQSPCAPLAEQSDEASAHTSASSIHVREQQSEQVLSCTLIWGECPDADLYHIFYQSREGNSTSLGDASQGTYLGSTGLSTFRAVNMRLLGNDDAISIAVSASGTTACWDADRRTSILVSAK